MILQITPILINGYLGTRIENGIREGLDAKHACRIKKDISITGKQDEDIWHEAYSDGGCHDPVREGFEAAFEKSGLIFLSNFSLQDQLIQVSFM